MPEPFLLARHRDACKDIVRERRDIEPRVLARAVAGRTDGRVAPNGSKTVAFRD